MRLRRTLLTGENGKDRDDFVDGRSLVMRLAAGQVGRVVF